MAPGGEDREQVLAAEQPVRRALHVHQILGVGADAAENAEDQLDEQRQPDQTTIEHVG